MSRDSFEPLFLSIDQGGQSSRAFVFDGTGRLHASGVVPVDTARPGSGWVEQDPVELLRSIAECLEVVAENLGNRVHNIRAAGLATQRSSIVCWDRVSGEPLSPVISWQDRRGEDQIAGLRGQASRVRRISGLVLSSHYGASKIRWCLENLPALQEALERGQLACGPLASYLPFHLCHERPFVVDPTIAARTLLWSLETMDWSTRLLEMFGVPRQVLPDCVHSRHDFGHIQLRGSAIPMTVSTGDQSAALFANGIPAADAALVNLGTGAFVQRMSNSPLSSKSRLLRSVVWHDSERSIHALEGSINGCGSALAKVGAEVGFDGESFLRHCEEWLARPQSPPLFLNGVSGLGSPYWVADYPTQVVGSGEPWQVMVAVLESILFLLQVNLEEMSRALGPPQVIQITGGLASSIGLCQRLADLSGVEVVRSDQREATARGLACLIAGLPQSTREGATDSFIPRANPQLEARFDQWREELEARLPTWAGL